MEQEVQEDARIQSLLAGISVGVLVGAIAGLLLSRAGGRSQLRKPRIMVTQGMVSVLTPITEGDTSYGQISLNNPVSSDTTFTLQGSPTGIVRFPNPATVLAGQQYSAPFEIQVPPNSINQDTIVNISATNLDAGELVIINV